VIVSGLKAKPQYNGAVGRVGELDKESGRFAIALRSNKSSKSISVKSVNLHHLGVFCRKRRKKSRVFECRHGSERCEVCYLDFIAINRLCKMKYSGDDICNLYVPNEVNETHFSSTERSQEEAGVLRKYSMKKADWPQECYGMESHPEQRLILKALLVSTSIELTINAEVAKTAFITFGGAKHLHLRAMTRLDSLVKVL